MLLKIKPLGFEKETNRFPPPPPPPPFHLSFFLPCHWQLNLWNLTKNRRNIARTGQEKETERWRESNKESNKEIPRILPPPLLPEES